MPIVGNRPSYNYNPALTYTLDSFINMKISDNMTYYNFSILEIIDGIVHLDHNLVEDYLPELKPKCVTVKLSNEELKRYRYCPDLLAYHIYESVQLDFIIMLLNDMVDPKEFDKQTIILPSASVLGHFLSIIYGKEAPYIQQNRAKLGLLV